MYFWTGLPYVGHTSCLCMLTRRWTHKLLVYTYNMKISMFCRLTTIHARPFALSSRRLRSHTVALHACSHVCISCVCSCVFVGGQLCQEKGACISMHFFMAHDPFKKQHLDRAHAMFQKGGRWTKARSNTWTSGLNTYAGRKKNRDMCYADCWCIIFICPYCRKFDF